MPVDKEPRLDLYLGRAHVCECTDVYMADQRLARLVEVASAYYLENRTQAEIAGSLGISRSQVSRYLGEARELGLVQIRIVAPEERVPSLGRALQQRFPHLRDAVVAPAFDTSPEAIRTIIGRYGANYLATLLLPNQRLMLGCGRTLRMMVKALPLREVPGVAVIQAMGNLGHEAHQIDYNEIVREAAEAMGGRAYYMSAPAILGSGPGSAADLIQTNPMLNQTLSLARQADVGVVGLGSMESDLVYTRFGLIQQDELGDLSGRAVGDICGRFFDINGREQLSAFSERIVGIGLEDLRRIPLAIGIAGGPDKVAPLLGAVRGRLINVLISDEQTARSILALDDTLPPSVLPHPDNARAGVARQPRRRR